MKTCSRCVMDSTIQVIEFDENGVCNYCENYQKRVKNELYIGKQREEALFKLIDKIKKQGADKPYDCIIGVSGGVDSSYVAHLVKKFELRPLAVHLDNGWNSELAVKNIEQLLGKLDIDLHTHVIDWGEFKSLQKAFIRSSVENLEIPTDHAINALLLNLASKYKIRYILNGSNLVTEGILPIQGGRNIDYRLLKDIHRKFGNGKLKTYPKISISRFAYLVLWKKIKYIPILNYVDFNKEQAIGMLEELYGWKRYGGKHYESIFTRFFQGYLLPEKYKYDKRKPHLSTLVMSGQITREEALIELQTPSYPNDALLEEDRAFFLKKLGYSEDEFNELMSLPVKKPTDYKSYESLFERFGSLMQLIKNYAKGE